jgi:Yip1 domain
MKWLFRIKAILLAPHAEWPAIAQEKGDPQALFIPYVAVLALVPALAHFIGAALVGGYAPLRSSLAGAVGIYLSGFAVVYVIALTTDALAPTFGAQRNFVGALKLAVYSYTPVWLCGIFLIVPGLSFLVIFGLYGIYLLRTGLPVLMRAPEANASRYTAVIAACALAIAVALGILETLLFSPD